MASLVTRCVKPRCRPRQTRAIVDACSDVRLRRAGRAAPPDLSCPLASTRLQGALLAAAPPAIPPQINKALAPAIVISQAPCKAPLAPNPDPHTPATMASMDEKNKVAQEKYGKE